MATWDGHLLGSFFLISQGLWWIILSIWYHLQSQPERKTNKMRSDVRCSKITPTTVLKTGCLKSWIPQPFFSGIPIEPIAKIVACGIGVFGETFLTLLVEEKGLPRRLQFGAFKIFNSSGDFVYVGKFQHVTMYSGFVLSGIVDLLVLFVHFPQATSPLFFTLAFISQSILFWFHMGHSVLNANYHKLHLVIIISCVIFSYLRTHHSKSFVVNTALGCSILLQGTWFFQAALLVYKDGKIYWELHKTEHHSEKLEHMVPMYLSAVFAWHLMVVAMTVLIAWTIMYVVVNKRCIVNREKTNLKWEALQSECTENLIEEELMVRNGSRGLEVDTEV